MGKENYRLQAPDSLPRDTWSHVTATFDNRMMRLYVNDREVATLERHDFIGLGGSNISVGAYNPTQEHSRFQGWLDSIRIYRRVLSPEEIADFARAY